MSPVGGNAASSSFEVDQFDTPSGGGGGAEVCHHIHLA